MTDILHSHVRSACGWATYFQKGESGNGGHQKPGIQMDVRVFFDLGGYFLLPLEISLINFPFGEGPY